jgi:hypothetical protein
VFKDLAALGFDRPYDLRRLGFHSLEQIDQQIERCSDGGHAHLPERQILLRS